MNNGRWSATLFHQTHPPTWIPQGCILHTYAAADTQNCLQTRHLVFLGDSTAREVFWAMARKLNDTRVRELSTIVGKHQDITFRSGMVSLKFLWDPFLNATNFIDQINSPERSLAGDDTNTLIVAAGLWHIKHLQAFSFSSFSESLLQLLSYTSSLSTETILLPTSISAKLQAVNGSGQTFHPARISELNGAMDNLHHDSSRHLYVNSFLNAKKDGPWIYQEDGLHLVDHVSTLQADILLSYICRNPDQVSPLGHRHSQCCIPPPSPSTAQRILLFVAIIFVVLDMVQKILTLLRRRHDFFVVSSTNHTFPGEMVQGCTVISLILLYCFMADRTTLLASSPKIMDEGVFIILLLAALVLGYATLTQSLSPGKPVGDLTAAQGHQILTRSQTDEWKGWMQMVILLYHYFGMSKVLWSYQLARLLVSSYLFMTGYGHTSYFVRTNDFSLQRLVAVLLRTNLLSVMLAFVMDTHYDLYYFPVLTSIWFLVTYVTLFRSSQIKNVREAVWRISISCLCFRTVLVMESEVRMIAERLAPAKLGLLHINGKELMFRLKLDGYVVYAGMLMAVVQVNCEDFTGQRLLNRLRLFSESSLRRVQHSMTLVGILGLVLYGILCACFKDKYAYNRWHPMLSPFAVLSYVALRNSPQKLRNRHSRVFAWFGRCSLETFMLQYHIWMCDDTRGLLRLRPLDLLRIRQSSAYSVGDWEDLVEVVITTSIFLWASSAASRALSMIVSRTLETAGRSLPHTQDQKSGAGMHPLHRVLGMNSHCLEYNLMVKSAGALLFLWVLNIMFEIV